MENTPALVGVAVLWGATNPLIRRGGQGIEQVQGSSKLAQFLLELKFLVFNWRYMLPFLLNQCGSVLFYWTLSSADLSMAVSITNSLTFIFNGLVGRLMGEDFGNKETYLGILMVILGIVICVVAKS